MRLWLQAIYLLCASQPVARVHMRILRLHATAFYVLRSGSITIREVQRTLGIGLKTAWFMSRRILTAMKDHERRRPGRQNQVVEATDKMLLMFRLAAISRGQNIDNAMPYEYRPKPGPKFDDPTQSKRFIDMARKLEADESNYALERAVAEVILPKSASRPE